MIIINLNDKNSENLLFEIKNFNLVGILIPNLLEILKLHSIVVTINMFLFILVLKSF